MASLRDVLINDSVKASVVDDCLAIIDAEVGDKGGISGLAIKAGYAAVKGINPGFIKQVVADLVPEFADALNAIWSEAKAQGKPIANHLVQNASAAADALLAITDGKAQRSKNALVKGTYEKLRGAAKKNVEAAVPRLGKLIEKYAT